MRRWFSWLACLAFSWSCAHAKGGTEGGAAPPRSASGAEARGASAEQERPRSDIEVSVAGKGADPAVAKSWLAYALAQAELWIRPGKTGSLEDRWGAMSHELAGRELLASTWIIMKPEAKADDAYLDLMVAVADAGLLPEYALVFLSEPGWYVTPEVIAKLDFDRFAAWAPAHLGSGEHFGLRGAWVTRKGGLPLFEPAPGSWTGALEQVNDARCAEAEPKLAAIVSRWESERAGLDGVVPVAAFDRQTFVAAVRALSTTPQAREHGILWVSPSIGFAHFQAGFCANARGDAARAADRARTAVELDPRQPRYQGELVHSLIVTQRFQEALRVIEDGLAWIDSPCQIAGLLRRRGYVYVELKEHTLARIAYLQSLEYEPGNEPAKNELRLIEAILRASGDTPGRDVLTEPLKPLPVIQQRCK